LVIHLSRIPQYVFDSLQNELNIMQMETSLQKSDTNLTMLSSAATPVMAAEETEDATVRMDEG